jgi:hypothetical protein
VLVTTKTHSGLAMMLARGWFRGRCVNITKEQVKNLEALYL